MNEAEEMRKTNQVNVLKKYKNIILPVKMKIFNILQLNRPIFVYGWQKYSFCIQGLISHKEWIFTFILNIFFFEDQLQKFDVISTKNKLHPLNFSINYCLMVFMLHFYRNCQYLSFFPFTIDCFDYRSECN